jgi:hypothetical protein
MAEHSFQSEEARIRSLEQIINQQGRQIGSLQHELKETKEELQSSNLRIVSLEAENSSLRPEPTIIPTCHHFLENGKLCRAAAVRQRRYCSYHLELRGRRLKMARARARRERWRVELPPLEDLYAVQVGIQHVVDALGAGQIDRHDARALLRGLQQAAANLRLPEEVWEGSGRFTNVEEQEWDSFEKEHGLPQNFDVDTPPEGAFPPAADSPEAPQEVTGGVTADDLELNELQTLDAKTCERRAGQLVRKYQRRLQRDREHLARAINTLEAAKRNSAPAMTAAIVHAAQDAGSQPLDDSAIGSDAKKPPQADGEQVQQEDRGEGAS